MSSRNYPDLDLPLHLSPGMAVTVEIKMASRSPLPRDTWLYRRRQRYHYRHK